MLKTLSSNQLRGIIQITRPKVSIVAASYSLLGAYLSGNARELLSSTVLRAALVVGLVVAFSFAINDYRDAETDRLNHPERPIPSGRISYRIARILSLSLALTALGIALTLALLLTIIAFFNIILSTLYSYKLKSTVLIGNTVIALLNTSIVIYGSLAVGRLIPVIWIISLLTFLYSLAQEILFAVGDQEGDAKTGLCTTATYLGTTVTLRLFQLIALSFVIVAIGVWFLGLVPSSYLFAMMPCSIFPLLAIVILLSRNVTNSSIHLSIQLIKFVRFGSLLPGILLK
jgi:geranylgeranylglycerol-phosphate geranylgeranyltransferase